MNRKKKRLLEGELARAQPSGFLCPRRGPRVSERGEVAR